MRRAIIHFIGILFFFGIMPVLLVIMFFKLGFTNVKVVGIVSYMIGIFLYMIIFYGILKWYKP